MNTIITSENPAVPAQQFTAVLTLAPSADVVIPVASSNTLEGDVSPDNTAFGPFSLTFTPANWNVPQIIYVKGIDDAAAEPTAVYSINLNPVTTTDSVYTGFDPQNLSAMNLDDDGAASTPGVIVVPSTSLVVSEAQTSSQFSVVLAAAPTAGVTVNLTSSNTGEGTVSPASLSFTAADWNIPKMATVTGVNDFFQDGNQPFTITVSSAGSASPEYQPLPDQTVNVTNNDNDTAGIAVGPAGVFVSESLTTQSFSVSLTSRPSLGTTVSFNVSVTDNSEALISLDNITYTSGPLSISFNDGDWNTLKPVFVKGQDDAVVDGDITSSVTFTASVSADPVYSGTFTPGPVSVVTFDNDTVASQAPGVTVNPLTGLQTSESGGIAQFAVVLTSSPTAGVTVTAASSNTAEGTVSPASLSFTAANWNIPQLVSVTGVADSPSPVVEANASYTVAVSSSGSAAAEYNTAAFNKTVNLVNIDNDAAGITTNVSKILTSENGSVQQFTIKLNTMPSDNISFTLNTSNFNEARISLDNATWVVSQPVAIAPASWNTGVTVFVKGWDDVTVDGDVNYTITFSGLNAGTDANYAALAPLTNTISGTNFDNDSGGVPGVHITPVSGLITTEFGGNAQFGAVLKTAPPAGCQINFTFTSTNTNAASAPASISFTSANWDSVQTVTVTGLNSALINANTPYSIKTAVASTPAGCSPAYESVAPPDVSITHIAKTPGVTVTPVDGLAVSESGSLASFYVHLNSPPAANVTIDVDTLLSTEAQTSLSSAGPFDDTTKTITFTTANWAVPQEVYVIGIDESIVDGSQSAVIQLSPTQSAGGDIDYQGGAIDPADVNIKVLDNDKAGVTIIANSSIVTTEGGSTQSFTVVLDSEPTVDVVLPLSVSDTTEASIIAPFVGTIGNLTFTAGACPGPGNWCQPKTVTIKGADDATVDGDTPYDVNFGTTQASGDANYHNFFTPAPITAVNLDNDAGGAGTPGITVIPNSLQMDEGFTAGKAFYVVLDTAPDNTVTVNMSIDFPGDGNISVSSLNFGPGSWNIPQMVMVTPLNDELRDGNKLFNVQFDVITGSDTTGYVGLNPPETVAVTVLDNEKLIFSSITNYPGNFGTLFAGGTIVSADTICKNDQVTKGYPSGTYTFKAMFTLFGIRQVFPEQIDWVLKPNATYYRIDGITKIMTTNAYGSYNLQSVSLTNSFTGLGNSYWTGMYFDWTPNTGTNCLGFANNGASNSGAAGSDFSVTSLSIAAVAGKCSDPYYLLCVEQ